MLRINDFFQKINRTELARPARFQVTFSRPNGLTEEYSNYIPELSFRCDAAQLPSRAVMTTDQKIYGYVEKFPYLTAYEDAQFTFLVGDDMKEKKLFDSWLRLVQPIDSYNLQYKSNYSTDVKVTQYSLGQDPNSPKKPKETYKVTLEKAYPIAVNQLDLDWGADGYHKLIVIFAYSSWKAS